MTLKYYSMKQKGIKAFYYLHGQASTFKKKKPKNKKALIFLPPLTHWPEGTVSPLQMTKPFTRAVPCEDVFILKTSDVGGHVDRRTGG